MIMPSMINNLRNTMNIHETYVQNILESKLIAEEINQLELFNQLHYKLEIQRYIQQRYITIQVNNLYSLDLENHVYL